ncbi:MAG: NUDIX domain-containing protein [Pseudomonadota bacterium]
MRRHGEPWLPGRPYRDRPGAYAIILGRGAQAGRVLCVDQEGELQLPGGGIDPGESPLQALHREVWEETGWRIEPLRRLATFQRFAWLPDYKYWARKVQSIYLAAGVRPLGPPQEPGHTVHWLMPGIALRHLGVEGDRAMLAAYLAGLARSGGR